MAVAEIRNIPLLLLYYFNIIRTYGLEDVIVDNNDTLQIMAWMPLFWLYKIFFSSYKTFLLLIIFGELYHLLNQIHKILQYVVITIALSILIYNTLSILIYNESWIGLVLEIINSILNIWTVSAFIVGLGFFGIEDSLEMNYGGVKEIILQSSILSIFLYPLIFFTKMVQYTFVDVANEEEPAPAA